MGISEIMGLFGNFGVLAGLLAVVAIVLYLAPSRCGLRPGPRVRTWD